MQLPSDEFNLLLWISQNWDAIVAAGVALILFADKLAKLTPTNADNDAIDFIKRKFLKKEDT